MSLADDVKAPIRHADRFFGPVLSVIPARDEADAVRIANDTIYGLNASVFTPDVQRALEGRPVGYEDTQL